MTLLGGDAHNNDEINILDLSFMGSKYGSSCGGPNFDARADINDDCQINILDISMSGNNYGRTSPVPW